MAVRAEARLSVNTPTRRKCEFILLYIQPSSAEPKVLYKQYTVNKEDSTVSNINAR